MHRLDWTPGLSTWYVNGQAVAKISFQAPSDPTTIIFNMWSNGGSWTSTMRVGEEALLQIQWIEMAYNMTDGYGGAKRDHGPDLDRRYGSRSLGHAGASVGKVAKRSVVCCVDGTPKIGTPSPL